MKRQNGQSLSHQLFHQFAGRAIARGKTVRGTRVGMSARHFTNRLANDGRKMVDAREIKRSLLVAEVVCLHFFNIRRLKWMFGRYLCKRRLRKVLSLRIVSLLDASWGHEGK